VGCGRVSHATDVPLRRDGGAVRHLGGRCGVVDSRSCKHGCVPIPDDPLRSVIGESPNEREHHRRSLWEYYDRRVTGRLPGLANAHAYWTGLGVTVEVEDIAAEAAQLERLLRELSAVRFVEVGAGPGTFTEYLAGSGIAIDQSRRALDVLRTVAPEVRETFLAEAHRVASEVVILDSGRPLGSLSRRSRHK
jgi:hypothetical protein